MGLFACALIVGAATFAMAGVPDLQETTATRAYTGLETLSLFNLPNGGGSAFADAYLPGGGTADATITLILRDGGGVVIPGFPGEDLWLESADGGMVPCTGGTVADFNTDVNGVTTWENPLAAGGQSTALCQVIVSGDPLTSNSGLAISFNSADINGDGAVNLTDVGNFSTDFYGAYNYRSDFVADGVLNLSDVGKLAVGVGAACP